MTAPVVVTVEANLTEAALARLEVALAPTSLLGFMELSIQPYIQERARQRFASQGDDVSGKWKALSDATVNFRTQGQIDYGAGPINVRTGALEAYITQSNGGFAVAGDVAVMTYPGSAPSGSNATGSLLDKVTAAQQGIPDPYTPARPVLGVNERDLAFTLTALEHYIGAFL